MDILQTWCSKWRIKLNPTKSQLLHLNSAHTRRNPPNNTLFGTPIPRVQEAKLLGLTFTAPNFNLLQHCQNLRTKAEARTNLLRALRGTNWGTNTSTLLHLYKTFIRPVLETGYPATVLAHHTALRHLSIAENHALRMALKVFYNPLLPRTSNEELHQRYGEPDILTRIRQLNRTALDRYQGSPSLTTYTGHSY